MDSFLVQVWVPADEMSGDADLRGVVRHVGSGDEAPFRGDAEVLRLLHRRRPTPAAAAERHDLGGRGTLDGGGGDRGQPG